MRILRLNSVSGPLGGVETYIENANKILSQDGHTVTTITLSTMGSLKNDGQNFVISTSSNSITRMFHDIILSEELLNRLYSVYSNFKPDIIHLHHFRIGFRTIFNFLMSHDTPVVFTAHDALAVCPLSTLVKPGNVICEGGVALRCAFTGCRIHSHLPYEMMLSRNFKVLAKSKIKALICPSYSIMNYLISNGFSPTVHLPSFSVFDENAVNKEPDFDEILSRKNIGFIGRLEWYKGVDDLIRGFAIFSTNHPEFHLLIAGNGPHEASLRKLVGALNIDSKVIWLGKINGEQREQFYNSIVCNVVPSKYWENFPLSAQESLLRSVPTIGTMIGGIPEIVQDGKTGFLVHISSPEEIALKLQLIVENRNNNVVNLMRNGRAFVMNHLTPEKNINGLLDIYNKVLNGIAIPNGYDENPTMESKLSRM